MNNRRPHRYKCIYVTFDLNFKSNHVRGLVCLRVAVGAYSLHCNWYHWSLSDFNSILLFLFFCLCSQLAGCFICLCFARTNTHYLYMELSSRVHVVFIIVVFIIFLYLYSTNMSVCTLAIIHCVWRKRKKNYNLFCFSLIYSSLQNQMPNGRPPAPANSFYMFIIYLIRLSVLSLLTSLDSRNF